MRVTVERLQLEVAYRRQAAEQALRESEQRFKPMMICASGPDKLATFFNAAWSMFTGRSMEQEPKCTFCWFHSSIATPRYESLARRANLEG